MSVLSDRDLKKLIKQGKLIIQSIKEEDIQPASIDLHLGFDLKNMDDEVIDLRQEDYILKPNEFILGSTEEYVEIPEDLVASVEGRSSIGRLGITAHITAGWIDPGFKGNITLEIHNVSNKPFKLKKDMSICQLVFQTLSSRCERPYGSKGLNSKYQNSEGTIISKYDK